MHHSPPNWKEARRFQAWQHQQKGWPQRRIAEALGVSEAAVSRWMQRARDGGPEALRHRPPPGAPRRLSADQLARLPALLRRGAEAFGCRGQGWACGRIAAVMHLEFGVSYHPVDVGRLLKALRWTPKSPPGERDSATKRPSPAGGRRPGLLSKGGTSPGANHPRPR